MTISLNKALWAVFLLLTFTAANAARVDSRKSTAVFYGPNLPTDVLSQFSRIIVEADNVKRHELDELRANGGDVFAYLSVGEVSPTRKWFDKIQPSWVLGDNRVWDSKVMDLHSPGWQKFMMESIVDPLWEAGYRGLFLDTMDSFKLFAKNERQEREQVQALVSLLQAIHKRYPEMRFIANRGFEVLPSIGYLLEAVAAESLFESWDNGLKVYRETKSEDQDWLLDQLHQVKAKLPVDIIIIDYVEPQKRDKAEKVASRITKEGFIPWISIPALDMVGVGDFQPQLKTYLLLTDSKTESHHPLELNKYSRLQRDLAADGLKLEVHDIQSGMPTGHLIGRYLGIITAQPFNEQFSIYQNWLRRQQHEGINIQVLNADAAIPSGS
ncbi:endo alpha-1,4 polygalactosaminidase [Leucothrix arctica]|uniref:endo alpha-1,4 polygalactosaminidase n=1 Tax=Leucothrix arctica TaxID=1481894 RepID=UPI001304C916|nr:endo alpha-1,4 polygalactosaminidase [Leucothrix arctica]